MLDLVHLDKLQQAIFDARNESCSCEAHTHRIGCERDIRREAYYTLVDNDEQQAILELITEINEMDDEAIHLEKVCNKLLYALGFSIIVIIVMGFKMYSG